MDPHLFALIAIRLDRLIRAQVRAGDAAREAREYGLGIAPALPVPMVEQAVMRAFVLVARAPEP